MVGVTEESGCNIHRKIEGENEMSKKVGIIFDMDGTLWDSAAGVAESWTRVVQKEYPGHAPVTTEQIQSVMGKTMDVIAQILFPELKQEAQMALLDKCCTDENDYLRENGGILYEGLENTLQTLKQDYELFIVSNCQSGYIEAFLEHYGFGDYFTDIECYGNNLKQKGDNIRLIMERNGITQGIYVGDIQGDYDAAKMAGADFIHAAYGFGTINEPVEAIHSIQELPHAIEEMGK